MADIDECLGREVLRLLSGVSRNAQARPPERETASLERETGVPERETGVPEREMGVLESDLPECEAGPRDCAPPGAPGRSLHLEPLAGGLGRRSYAASIGRDVYVVRAPCDAPGVLDFATEIEIVREAASLDIAPAVVASDAAAGILITEYRAGARALTPAAARLPENIVRIAALLKRLHRIRRGVRGFDPEGFAAEYLAALGGIAALDAPDRRRAAEFHTLARDYRSRYPRIVLCHNDVYAPNILDDGRLWLIDFEYAVMAAPVLDLAGLVVMNDFGRYEGLQAAEAYYADSPVPFSAAEFDKVVRLVRIMSYFWALSSSRRAADPTPYTALAGRFRAALD